jgi:hypothetical protein
VVWQELGGERIVNGLVRMAILLVACVGGLQPALAVDTILTLGKPAHEGEKVVEVTKDNKTFKATYALNPAFPPVDGDNIAERTIIRQLNAQARAAGMGDIAKATRTGNIQILGVPRKNVDTSKSGTGQKDVLAKIFDFERKIRDLEGMWAFRLNLEGVNVLGDQSSFSAGLSFDDIVYEATVHFSDLGSNDGMGVVLALYDRFQSEMDPFHRELMSVDHEGGRLIFQFQPWMSSAEIFIQSSDLGVQTEFGMSYFVVPELKVWTSLVLGFALVGFRIRRSNLLSVHPVC